MATIHIDGTSYEVDGSDNLLHACLSLGLEVAGEGTALDVGQRFAELRRQIG